MYHSAWADHRLATVSQIICKPVYKCDQICNNRLYCHNNRNLFYCLILYTQALSRHGKNIAIDGRVCFTDGFSHPVKLPRFTTESVEPLRCINKTAWGAKLLPAICLGLALRAWPGIHM